MHTPAGALILGNEYQALGMVRQLRAAGVRCALVDQDRWGVALLSRFRCPFHHSPKYGSDAFWPWLIRLAETHRYVGWTLIPTDDEQVRHMAMNLEKCREIFRYSGLPWEQYRSIYDKRANYRWCIRNGISAPRSFLPQNPDDLPGPELPFPLIVKPAFKRNYSRYCKAKAIRIDSAAALHSVLRGPLRHVPVEELLYQELIPGDGRSQWSYAGLFENGEPVAAFTACRRRQHPPDFGRASTYVIAEPDAEVERESRRVLKHFGYTGLAEVEWKRDPRDGVLKFLEVNARSWGWHSLASRVVGNLPHMLVLMLSGHAVPRVAPRYGWRWVKHLTDVPVAVDLWRRRELACRDYVRSLRGPIVCCEWDDGDWRPFFLQALLIPYLMGKRGY